MNNNDQHLLAIVIPAYNEAPVIGELLDALPRAVRGVHNILPIVVDDGSCDNTYLIAKEHGATVLRHRVNRGVGLARRTGLAAARFLNADIAVTLDADGQHDPTEIEQVIAPVLDKTADIVIGSRLLHAEGMPLHKQIVNRFGTLILRIFWGVNVSDSQSGFRAYNLKSTQSLKLQTSGYESDTEILIAANEQRLGVTEVPIRAIYTKYSMGQGRGQSVLNGVNILIRLAIRTILG